MSAYLARQLKMAAACIAAGARPGEVRHAILLHDDGCPALLNIGSTLDCRCDPDVIVGADGETLKHLRERRLTYRAEEQ